MQCSTPILSIWFGALLTHVSTCNHHARSPQRAPPRSCAASTPAPGSSSSAVLPSLACFVRVRMSRKWNPTGRALRWSASSTQRAVHALSSQVLVACLFLLMNGIPPSLRWMTLGTSVSPSVKWGEIGSLCCEDLMIPVGDEKTTWPMASAK